MNLAAAERGAASVRQARIERVQKAIVKEFQDQVGPSHLRVAAIREDGTLSVHGVFSLRALAEAVDKVI